MCVCKMTRGHGLGEPSSLSAPLPGLNLSRLTLINLFSLSSATDSGDNKRNNPADLCDRKLTAECYHRTISLSLSLSTSHSDVEKSLLTMKAGYRNIRDGVLKAVRGKRQINTFHIPLQWSAIDHGPRASTPPLHSPAWSVAAKHAILIRQDGSECVPALLLFYPRLICSSSALILFHSIVSSSPRADGAKKWFQPRTTRRKRRCEQGSDRGRRPAGLEGLRCLPQILNSVHAHLQTPSVGNFLLHLRFLQPPWRCNPGPVGGPCADDNFWRPITFIPLNVISFIPPPLPPKTPCRPPDTIGMSAVLPLTSASVLSSAAVAWGAGCAHRFHPAAVIALTIIMFICTITIIPGLEQ